MAELPKFREPRKPEGVIDVRCPAGPPRGDGTCDPGKLLLRIRQNGEQPTMVQPNNLMELSCDDCTRKMRRRGRAVKRVLHRYDFSGTLIESLIVEDT